MIEVVLNDAVKFGDNHPLVLIAGPCVIESKEHCEKMAREIKRIAESLDIPFVFKASFDKANRSSIKSFRGPGLERGLEILYEIKTKLSIPVTSDIHDPEQAYVAAEVLDIIQIPAFLCRQTDIVVAAGETGKVVNVKKGQFMAPWDMANVVKKIEATGNKRILLTERGVSFGYNNLVVDMTSLPLMRDIGYPVVFDATHSVQQPGGGGEFTSGRREYVPHLARAAAAVGIDALFLEVHDQPEQAKSDGPNMVRLSDLPSLLRQVKAIDSITKASL